MSAIDLGAVSALWLGILTSMSPCPLATNIAAVSYIGRQYRSPARVTFSSLAYVLGRMGAYLGLGALLVAGLLSAPGLSMFLQKSMNKILGPVLILTGMVLLDLLRFPTLGGGVGEKMREKAGQGGIPGAGLLGILFALSFCPVSAALFFGSLLPLSVAKDSPVFYPLLFGFGTGIPVIAFAVMIAFGMRSIEAVFRGVTRVELWVRRITGAVFIVAGSTTRPSISSRCFDRDTAYLDVRSGRMWRGGEPGLDSRLRRCRLIAILRLEINWKKSKNRVPASSFPKSQGVSSSLRVRRRTRNWPLLPRRLPILYASGSCGFLLRRRRIYAVI